MAILNSNRMLITQAPETNVAGLSLDESRNIFIMGFVVPCTITAENIQISLDEVSWSDSVDVDFSDSINFELELFIRSGTENNGSISIKANKQL